MVPTAALMPDASNMKAGSLRRRWRMRPPDDERGLAVGG